jgi:predicted small secreted protein
MVSASSKAGLAERGSKMKLLLTLGVAGLWLLSAGGCSTVEGFGRDVERLGDTIEDEAQDTRQRRRRED